MWHAPTKGARRACNPNERRTREASPTTTANNPLPETITPFSRRIGRPAGQGRPRRPELNPTMKNQPTVCPYCIGLAIDTSTHEPRHEKRPAPAATGTGQGGAGEGNHDTNTEAHGGAAGNPGRADFAPPLFIPPGTDLMGEEASRLESLARAAEGRGHEVAAARCTLLAAALAHAMARVQQGPDVGRVVTPETLADEVLAIRSQARESLGHGDSFDIATGYQLDAAAFAYALATARNPIQQ